MGRTGRLLPAVWTVAVALLLLGPALAPGYVNTYDMVWVPDLALRPDFLGVGSGLPRAVPSDAVVAVLDEAVPGMVLQKLVLLGGLVAGGLGASRLCADLGVGAQCLASALYVWNPFTVERLLMGHWPVLLGYAVLPWLVLSAREFRNAGRPPFSLLWLLPVGCLSASAGIASAVAVLAFGLRRGRGRANLGLVALAVVANLPWLVAGLLHAGVATSDPAGAQAFALRGAGPLPAPLTALGLGGIWNAEAVPPSQEGVLAVVALLAVAVLVVVGSRSWLRAHPVRDRWGYAACWVVGWGTAVLTWATPEASAWLAAEVPGGGLLRDGSRLLGLCAPLLVTATAHGGEQIARAFRAGWQRWVAVGALALLPVALVPDAAVGVGGRLDAVRFPPSYEDVRDRVGDAGGADVLVLPFSSYRAPEWNDGRKVLDPLGRFLAADYVASDELVVSGVRIEGEDPRGDDVRRALALPGPQQRAEQLAALGIGVVVRDLAAPGPAPEISGAGRYRSGGLVATTLPGPVATSSPGWWVPVMWVVWLVWLLVPALGLVARIRAYWLVEFPRT